MLPKLPALSEGEKKRKKAYLHIRKFMILKSLIFNGIQNNSRPIKFPNWKYKKNVCMIADKLTK